MAKTKTAYVCSDCGTEHKQWQGQCASCGAWNTLTRISLGANTSPVANANFKRIGFSGTLSGAQSLSEVSIQEQDRLSTASTEFDRVLGKGMVPGSAVLIGGNPGAGKSTLLLQLMCKLSENRKTLYVTGEESIQQIAIRARRLHLPTEKLQVLAETDIQRLTETAETLKPEVMVIDSIQVMHSLDIASAPGSVSQVRDCAAYLVQFAKQTNTVLFLVGHVTKDGTLAGPKVLEHMIDCFLMLEGGDDSRFRTLRSLKNRFGAVNEVGIFAMTEAGLKEVKNPSAIFLARTEESSSGSLVTVLWEGTRPLLIEIQALVDSSGLGNPRRIAVGLDHNRLTMLLAALHRHGGLFMADQDVFVNVVGGVRVSETAADLALILAIVSSFRDRIVPRELVVFGEVGLAGEIRPVNNGQERLSEAAKHGFTCAIVPKANAPKKAIPGIDVIAVTKLSEALVALNNFS
jgi:DNA repair protein RadA/Sms